jgi:drug/metabolite transporter (DMT)-like permease
MVFIFGIDRTTASNSAIIIASSPILIALLSLWMKHEKLHVASWIGIAISFAGLYFVVSSRYGAIRLTEQGFVGDILIFFGNISWAFFTVLSKPFLTRVSPLKLSAWTMSLGTVLYVPFCLRDLLNTAYTQISLEAWLILLYSGLFSLGICYVIWYSSVRRVGNSRTSVYDNILPVFTVVFAYFLLGERLSTVQALGALVIFMGVYLTRSGYKWFIKRDKKT